MNPEKILNVSTLAGRLLLESGAEIYRVEETISRLCECYQADEVSSFVTPSGIFVSFLIDGRTYSKVVRVKSSSLNLERIHEVNAISRNSCKDHLDVTEVESYLKVIASQPTYSVGMKLLASGGIAASFAIFFQGSLREGFCAFVIGISVRLLLNFLEKRRINSFVMIMLASSFIALLALVFEQLGLHQGRDAVILGCMMLLVPGLSITNAIRDSISGDLLSGMTRGVEACLIAIALALGAGVTISFWVKLLGGI